VAESELQEQEHERGTVSIKPVLAGLVILVAVIAGLLIYSCAHAPPSGSFTDRASRYSPGSVTYLAAGRTYLLNEPDGTFVALSEVDADADARLKGCIIRYRPDLSAGNQSGVFRDDCGGTLFDREGMPVQGSSPPMQRHAVQVAEGNVTVRFNRCLSASGAAETCRE
jgi:hypothetical protein